jgi:aspartate aminotransferase
MPQIPLAGRVTSIRVSPSTAANQRARDLKARGRDILDLTVGEPDFDTPDPHQGKPPSPRWLRARPNIRPVNGTLALRKAVRHDFLTRLGIDYATG